MGHGNFQRKFQNIVWKRKCQENLNPEEKFIFFEFLWNCLKQFEKYNIICL